MDEEMEEIIRGAAQQLIDALHVNLNFPQLMIADDVNVEWDDDYNCFVTVATFGENSPLVQVWYGYTLDDEHPEFWVGFGAFDEPTIRHLVADCPPEIHPQNGFIVRNYDELRNIPLVDVLAGPVAEFCPGPYNGFGIYQRPGVKNALARVEKLSRLSSGGVQITRRRAPLVDPESWQSKFLPSKTSGCPGNLSCPPYTCMRPTASAECTYRDVTERPLCPMSAAIVGSLYPAGLPACRAPQ